MAGRRVPPGIEEDLHLTSNMRPRPVFFFFLKKECECVTPGAPVEIKHFDWPETFILKLSSENNGALILNPTFKKKIVSNSKHYLCAVF